ncbi:MAG: nucleotidyltransferase domain-containing protein [Pseudomonadota bacterium]
MLVTESPRTIHLPERYRLMVLDAVKRYIPRAEVWAYGSRVRGDWHEASDLDLVVRFPEAHAASQSFSQLEKLREALSESALPIFVQIVDWDRIPETFREEIRACHARFYAPGEQSSSP